MERPTGGVASGGVGSAVGAACQAVVDHLAAGGGRRASVWLEDRGQLRAVAVSGDAGSAPTGSTGSPGTDRTSGPPSASPDGHRPGPAPVVRSAFEAGIETLIPDLASARADPEEHGDDAAGFHGRACLPIAGPSAVAGVLDVLVEDPIGPADLHSCREAATELARHLAPSGARPAQPPAERVLRHVARLTSLQEHDAIARTALTAALELTGFAEGAILRRTSDGQLQTLAAIGPFAAALRAGAPDALEAIAAHADGFAHVTLAHGAGPAAGADGLALAAPLSGATVAGDGGGPVLAGPSLVRRALAAAGIEALLSVGLNADGAPPAVLLLAGAASAVPEPAALDILEALAANVAACLRTAELLDCLRRRAATDPLTGLGHHASFHETLAQSHRRPRTAVVLIDVDGFKHFNDTFGHQHGDAVLRGVADALRGALRRGDSLFRVGGDEFAALLAVSSEHEALDAGERLRAAAGRAGLGVTLSIGVAVAHDDEPDAVVLDRADQALYRVKARGRDGVELAAADRVPIAPPR